MAWAVVNPWENSTRAADMAMSALIRALISVEPTRSRNNEDGSLDDSGMPIWSA